MLPFSTAMIADFGTERLSVGICIGTIALHSVPKTGLRLHIDRPPELVRPVTGGPDSTLTSEIVAAALMLTFLVFGVVFPQASFFGLVLLLLGACDAGYRPQVSRGSPLSMVGSRATATSPRSDAAA